MTAFLNALLRYRTIVLILLAASLAGGTFGALKLDVEAYPDPSPPLVEIITQNPAWSAEEMEQQVTVPVELALNGTPQLDQVRSISIFGLSDVKLYFKFSSDLFHDREEVLARLQTLQLPKNLQPQLSPWSPIGEIYRYQVTGPYSLNDLKATQDWLIRRELKQVPGIVDITTFGGTTKQYQIEADPNKLLAFGVTLQQLILAVQNSDANAGGNYLSIGDQNVNVRSAGAAAKYRGHREHGGGGEERDAGGGARCGRGAGGFPAEAWQGGAQRGERHGGGDRSATEGRGESACAGGAEGEDRGAEPRQPVAAGDAHQHDLRPDEAD